MEVGVDYISDIHVDSHIKIDFNTLKWKEKTQNYVRSLLPLVGENSRPNLLIIAGDISASNVQIEWVIEAFHNYYKHILYVLGNHEYYLDTNRLSKKYKHKSNEKIADIKNRLLNYEGVLVVDNMLELNYMGKKIVAGTLWYNLDRQEKLDYYNNISNDSQYIKNVDIPTLNNQAISLLESTSDIDLVVTHMPPYETVSIKEDKEVACYNGEVDLSVIDTQHWVYGHTHENRTYTKDIGVRKIEMHTNTVGYKSEKKATRIKSIVL